MRRLFVVVAALTLLLCVPALSGVLVKYDMQSMLWDDISVYESATSNGLGGCLYLRRAAGGTSRMSADNPFGSAGNFSIEFFGNDRAFVEKSASIAPGASGTNQLTLEAWFKPTAHSQGTIIRLFWPSGSCVELALLADGRPSARYKFDGTWHAAEASSPLALDTWSHLALTFDGGDITLYINAQEAANYDGAFVAVPSGTLADSVSGGIAIGGSTSFGHISGLIDDVMVSDTVVPPSQLGYHAPFVEYLEPVKRTIALYPLDALYDDQQNHARNGIQVMDASGNGIHGTEGMSYGSYEVSPDDPFNSDDDNSVLVNADGAGATLFTYPTDKIDINNGGRNAFTYEAWFKPVAYGGAITSMSQGSTHVVVIGQYASTGLVDVGFWEQGKGWVYLTTTEPAPLDEWTHVAMTYDGCTLKLYVNGELDGVKYNRPYNFPIYTWASSSYFKISGTQTYGQFTGYISDVRLTQGVLEPEELGYHRSLSSIQPLETSTVAAYNMDQETTYVTFDVSGNGYDASWRKVLEWSPDNPFGAAGNKSIRLYGRDPWDDTSNLADVTGNLDGFNFFNGAVNEFTIEGWIKLAAADTYSTLVQLSWTNKVVGVGLYPGGRPSASTSMGAGWRNAIATNPLPFDEWKHIAGIYKNGYLRVYVDGEEVASVYSGAILPDGAPTGVIIGGGGAWGPTDGFLDDIRISRKALPVSELGFNKSLSPPPPTPVSISDARKLEDGASVECSGYFVSAKFGTYFYIESANRSSGIRVGGSDSGLAIGQEVRVVGKMDTLPSGERYIAATEITGLSGVNIITPLGMSNKAMGGGDSEGQVGVSGGTGLNNIGLLVRTTGKVTQIASDRYRLDDGSGVSLVAQMASGSMADESYVAVTGISSCERDAEDNVQRLLLVQSADDVSTVITVPTDIVGNGAATGVIVTAESPSTADLFAAEEVQIYLEKMTGVVVPIVQGAVPEGKTAIIVGNHPDAAAVNADLQAFSTDKEAFALVSEGRRLYIVGNGETAVCYGAWEWLESLGVRWILPTEKGEYIPHYTTLSIAPVRKFDAPAMSYRGPAYTMNSGYGYPVVPSEHGYSGTLMFSARKRLNRNSGLFRSDLWIGIGSGHSYRYYLPASKYYADHPEWFNLIGGQRVSSGEQVCFTNREAANEFARNILVDVRYWLSLGCDLYRILVSVSPNDGVAWCECANCQQLADYDPYGALTSATSMVVKFANMVAEEVHKEFPTAKIVFYAYCNYTRPPTKVMPAPDVYPELVFWCGGESAYANHAHPMFSDINSRYRDYFSEWARISTGISSHEYYGHYSWFTPWPKVTQMSYDIKEMEKNPKFYGMYSESHHHWGTQGPNLYLHPKLMWNPDLNVSAVMDDYYTAGYGPAAPYIKQYFQTLQAKMDSLAYVGGDISEVPNLLTPQIIAQCNGYTDSAETLLQEMDANTGWRTNLVVQAWRNSVKIADSLTVYKNPTGDKAADRALIQQNLADVVAYANSPDGLWAFQNAVLKYSLQGIYLPINLNLGDLRAGQHEYSEYLWWGGCLKYYADMTGLLLWPAGIYLSPGVHGVIDLPIRAQNGRTIASLTVKIGWRTAASGLAAKISVVKPDGTTVVVAPNLAAATGDVTIPWDLLGQQVRLRIECDNLLTSQILVMNQFTAKITVQ
jgi:hypothetical protein